jgi:hypothetical protein
MGIRKRIVAGVLCAGLFLAGAPGTMPEPAVPPVPFATAVAEAKTCRPGWTRARIDGQVKCLRAGQFCKRSADRQYRRYGFRCTTRTPWGYRLTRA